MNGTTHSHLSHTQNSASQNNYILKEQGLRGELLPSQAPSHYVHYTSKCLRQVQGRPVPNRDKKPATFTYSASLRAIWDSPVFSVWLRTEIVTFSCFSKISQHLQSFSFVATYFVETNRWSLLTAKKFRLGGVTISVRGLI